MKDLRYHLLKNSICTVLLGSLLLCTAIFSGAEESQESLWQHVRSGNAIVLMRHAIAPGVGDPDSFTLGDCTTQRNLSETGRLQARGIGELFRTNGITKARVFSSQWCRCLETAKLLELGTVEELVLLNSFFRFYERAEQQTLELRSWITQNKWDQPRVLVTHQVNITSLTGIFPNSGEMVIVKQSASGTLSVLGTIETDRL